MTDIPLPDAFIGLGEAYLDAYEAIVRSNRVMAIRRYLVERWANVLSPVAFWLVAELRQQCYLNHDQDWCRVSQATLARQIHVDRTTVIRLLGEETDPLHRFIHREKRRRFSQRAGRSVVADSFYQVVVSDPLAPVDQAGLYRLLSSRAEGLPGLLKELAGLQRGELYTLLEQQSQESAPRWMPTVRNVVRDLHGPETTRQPEVATLCSELNRAITRPDLKLLVEWYFRDKWLPRLGHARALLVLTLKARCYHSTEEGVDRNQLRLFWSEIGQQIGKGKADLRRLRNHPDVDRFFHVEKEGIGRTPSEVVVGTQLVPLVPEDEGRYLSLVTKGEPYSIHPETGQMDMLGALDDGQERDRSATYGEGDHFATYGQWDHSATYERDHFATQWDRFASQWDHFATQTIKALQALIRSSTTAASTGEPEAAAVDFPRPSFSPEELAALEAGLPSEWAAALRRADNNRKRVSILLDMARTLGLIDADCRADRRA